MLEAPTRWPSLNNSPWILLYPQVPPDTRELLDGLRRELLSELMTAERAAIAVGAVLELRHVDPPSTWSPPISTRVSWYGLTQIERVVLQEALWAATAAVDGVELWLFGSRATGTATEDSDYDLVVVVPDDVPPPLHGRAMGDIWLAMDRGRGVRSDRNLVLASSFKDPVDKDRVLVLEVRAYGFRVPPPGKTGSSAGSAAVQ